MALPKWDDIHKRGWGNTSSKTTGGNGRTVAGNPHLLWRFQEISRNKNRAQLKHPLLQLLLNRHWAWKRPVAVLHTPRPPLQTQTSQEKLHDLLLAHQNPRHQHQYLSKARSEWKFPWPRPPRYSYLLEKQFHNISYVNKLPMVWDFCIPPRWHCTIALRWPFPWSLWWGHSSSSCCSGCLLLGSIGGSKSLGQLQQDPVRAYITST